MELESMVQKGKNGRRYVRNEIHIRLASNDPEARTILNEPDSITPIFQTSNDKTSPQSPIAHPDKNIALPVTSTDETLTMPNIPSDRDLASDTSSNNNNPRCGVLKKAHLNQLSPASLPEATRVSNSNNEVLLGALPGTSADNLPVPIIPPRLPPQISLSPPAPISQELNDSREPIDVTQHIASPMEQPIRRSSRVVRPPKRLNL
ncbi:hypothetical protein ACJJTC_011799 [Scirpophaga incertulas]